MDDRRSLRRAPAAMLALVLFTAWPLAPAAAQDAVLIDMKDFSPHELRSGGFRLDAPQSIRIDAVGADADRRNWFEGNFSWGDDEEERNGWRGNAWILDARTRKVVWELRQSDTKGGRRDSERFEGTVQLPAGVYEVYFASYSGNQFIFDKDWRDLIGTGRDSRRREYRDDGLSKAFKFEIRGSGKRLSTAEMSAARADLDQRTVISLTGLGPDATRRRGFQLSRPTDVQLYAIGEARDRSAFDYGWLIDVSTGERLWRLDYDESDAAGGADKNRVVRWTKRLPAGRYALTFATDDSHDATDWNSPPPYDPGYYGVTLFVANAADRSAVSTFEYQPAPMGEAIASLVRVGDDETRSQGFTLTRPMGVRILALGEGRDGDMNDYGWIMNARTHKRVWTMSYNDTEHAGGDEKNRLVDTTIRLEPGSYIVHYRTDGSHSYEEWNASRPMDAELWGITLLPARGGLDKEAVKPFDERSETSSVIARLTRMGDNERRRVRFTLERDTDVEVYALGEGDSGEMYDYAWIEDARGRTVWEMDYGDTDHAGGARKNRMFQGTIRLDAGEYVVHYRSDGSHSYEDWNADQPDDPGHWGVTISKK
jgi:hypothetical protein